MSPQVPAPISLDECIIKRFEQAWQTGERPDIAGYLHSDNSKLLLIELVHIELEFRFRQGENPSIETYFDRFPVLRGDPSVAIDFIATEFFFRQRYGHVAKSEEYLTRFPEYREVLSRQLANDASTFTLHRRQPGYQIPGLPQIPGYIIEEELGHGGMGMVYRAMQPALQRVVAIKTLMHGIATTSEVKQLFRNETEAIARLNHPNLVPVYEVGEWQPEGATITIPYFVMKFYAGGSLTSHPAGKNANVHQQARLVETIAHAIHHAHQRGILHRDLKPSNILLDEHDDPHIADFGLAGRFDPNDPQSMTAMIKGTPSYMAPEQAHSPSQVTTATDVYGLGGILYFLLVGQPPFQASTPYALLDIVAHQRPVRPSLLNPAVSRDLEMICLKCLEKDPARRYGSAEALALDLERYRLGRSITARPMPLWERGVRLVRRYPVISFLVLLTFASLITSVVILAQSYLRIKNQEEVTSDALQRERWAHNELMSTFHREQQLLYGKRMASVSRLWETNQLPQAWAELEACPQHLRGWEWHYFQGLRGIEPAILNTPESVVRHVAFVDPQHIITGNDEGKATLWNWRSKTKLKEWQAVPEGVRALAVHAPQKWLAICNQDILLVWNYETQEKLASLPCSMWIAFSPDGKFLASTHTNDSIDNREVKVWSTSTWKEHLQLKGHTKGVLNGAFSPDSQTLVTTSADRSIRRWDLVEGKPIGPAWKRPLPVFELAYLADGRHIAEAQPASLHWSDAVTGNELGKYEWSTEPATRMLTSRVHLATNQNSRHVTFSGPSHDVQIWDISRNKSVTIFRGHTMHINSVKYSCDGKYIVSTSNDKTVRIWSQTLPHEFQTMGSFPFKINDVVLSPDGRYIAGVPHIHALSGANDKVRVLNTEDGSLIGEYPGRGTACFTRDGFLIAAQHAGGVICWNLQTQQPVWQTTGEDCLHLCRGSDDKTVAVVLVNRCIVKLDAATGKQIGETQVGERQPLTGMISLSENLQFASVLSQPDVQLWKLSSSEKLNSFPMNGTRRMQFSPNNSFLAIVQADRVIQIRSVMHGQLLLTFPGHPKTINSIAFSRDGKRLVTSCADGRLRLWDVETGNELVTLPGQFEDSVVAAWNHETDQILAVDSKLHVFLKTPIVTERR